MARKKISQKKKSQLLNKRGQYQTKGRKSYNDALFTTYQFKMWRVGIDSPNLFKNLGKRYNRVKNLNKHLKYIRLGLRLEDDNKESINVSTVTYARRKLNIQKMFEELYFKSEQIKMGKAYQSLLDTSTLVITDFFVFYSEK